MKALPHKEDVCAFLSQGYGIEDIAVHLNVKPQIIREKVQALRLDGSLDAIWANPASEARHA